MTNNLNSLDQTPELTLEVVKKRSLTGVAVLTARTLVLNVTSFIAQGLLWLFIGVDEYGIFLLVTATVNFLSYFADIGLGAALIQKKEKPEKKDFETVFLVQECLVLTIVVVVFLVSPMLVKSHSLGPDGRNLLYALNIAFFLASLKNIPSIILERKLEFGKFVIPQVLENLVYHVTLVYFAWKGFGINSFTYAVLARGFVGILAIYIVQPWVPSIGFSKSSLKNLLKYGIPYQLNSFLATIKDDGITILLGGILGPFALGIIGTAQKLSQYPLRFFMDNVNKVTFPAFSRMQDNKDDLTKSFNRSVFFICALVYPTLVGMWVLFPVLIAVVPKYQKWELALIPLAFFSINSMWGAFTTQITNLFAAIGKISIVVKLMIMWTSLSWLLIPFLAKNYGINGAAVAFATVSSSSIVALVLIKKEINFAFKDSVINPLIASIAMGIYLFLLKQVFVNYDLFKLITFVLFGGLAYLMSLYLIVGKTLFDDVKKILVEFKRR